MELAAGAGVAHCHSGPLGGGLAHALQSRTLMVLLNLFFTWLASLAICVLTARGFSSERQPGLLMFGWLPLIGASPRWPPRPW